jgi:hypothetical protein
LSSFNAPCICPNIQCDKKKILKIFFRAKHGLTPDRRGLIWNRTASVGPVDDWHFPRDILVQAGHRLISVASSPAARVAGGCWVGEASDRLILFSTDFGSGKIINAVVSTTLNVSPFVHLHHHFFAKKTISV